MLSSLTRSVNHKQGPFPRGSFSVFLMIGTMTPSDSLLAFCLLTRRFIERIFSRNYFLGQRGSLQFRVRLSPHSIPRTPEESNTPCPRFDVLSIAFARYDLLGLSCLSAHNVTTLQDSLYVTDCDVAPIWPNGLTRLPKGLVTPLWSQESLLETGVSYPMSWHLSEQDFHLRV